MNEKAEPNNTPRRILIPLVIVIAVVPLIIMVHEYSSGLDSYPWFGNEKKSFDIYFYYKALLLKTCGAISVVIAVGQYIKNKPVFLQEKKSLAPIVALVFFTIPTILSSSLSSHPWEASFGGYGRFEGCYVILSYVIFFYIAFGYARSLKLIRFILDSIVIGSSLLSLLGVIEALGVNIYNWSWLQSFMSLLESNARSFETTDINIVSSTLDNPNYVGSYVVLVLPYCVYILLREKTIWRRIIAGIAIDLLGIFLFGSESDTGLFAVAFSVVLTLFFVFPVLKRNSKIIIASFSAFIFVLIMIFLLTGDFSEHLFVESTTYPIDNMETDFNNLIISTSGGKRIIISLDEEMASKDGWSDKDNISELMSIKDGDSGELIKTRTISKSSEKLESEGYPDLTFTLNGLIIPKEISSTGYESIWDILIINDGIHDYRFSTFMGANICYLYNKSMDQVLLRNVERYGFDGLYGIANGRGYIWACTIPLLKDYIFIGAGQDNYIYVFPNDDYVGKLNSGYYSNYQNKPHNMYLGIWVQQGLIALLAFLFLYFLFMVRVIRLCYGKHKVAASDGFSARGVAVVTAIGATGYMVAGLANDSNVGVTPIFWVMLGVGYAAEAICRKKDIPESMKEEEAVEKEALADDYEVMNSIEQPEDPANECFEEANENEITSNENHGDSVLHSEGDAYEETSE